MTEIIIEIEGGNVQAVYSTDPNISVDILDHDNGAVDEEIEKENMEFAKRANSPQFHLVL